MTCTVWQITEANSKGENPNSKVLTVVLIEEICLRSPDNTTAGICNYINRTYTHRHESTTYIYGDPTGMKEDTRTEAGHNDYVIIRRQLAALQPQLRISRKAPSVYMRISFMNALFAGAIKDLAIGIDQRCQHTINDFLYIKEESNGTKQKIRGTDPVTGILCEKYGHLSDSAEYFICTAFIHHYARFTQRGSAPIVVGRYMPSDHVRPNRWSY